MKHAIEQRIIPEWTKNLVVEKMSRKAFDSLGEYSCSQPTGVFVGKVWKRDLFFGTGHEPFWVICEYVAHPTKPDMCRTDVRLPDIKEAT